MISLDIKNAFGSIRKNSILKMIDKYKVPNGLKNMIADYLDNRKVILKENDMLQYNVGVPQGSSLDQRFGY